MKITNVNQIEDFLSAVNKCEGDVFLTSIYGDKYNLKSALSRYIAIAALLGDRGSELELWCTTKDDENYFRKFFIDNPETL